MIKAIVHKGNQTTEIKIPNDTFSLRYDLLRIGIQEKLEKIPLTDNKDEDIRVSLYSESDFGNALIRLFKPHHTLADVNVLANIVADTRPELQDDIEQYVLHDQYYSPRALAADIEEMTNDLVTVSENFYCPLKVSMNDDEYGDCYEVSNSYAVSNEDVIRETLQKIQDEDTHNIAYYFDGNKSAKVKIVSAEWDVAVINGVLYGVIHTNLTEAFTPEEEAAWKDEITGQASDGFGESFEQTPIPTDDGDIYVSFWNNSDNYFVYNQAEMNTKHNN